MIKIRKYEQTDWKAICEIHDKARIDELTGSANLGAFLTLEQTFKNEGLFDGEVLVATENKIVNGFIAYEPNQITWLYIKPKDYQKGIGTILIKEAIKNCDNKIEIVVLTGNKPALNLYKKLGFKIIRTTKGKLEGNETYEAEAHRMSFEKNI